MRRSREIQAQVEAGSIGKKSRHRKRTLEDDDTFCQPRLIQRGQEKFSGTATCHFKDSFLHMNTHTALLCTYR